MWDAIECWLEHSPPASLVDISRRGDGNSTNINVGNVGEVVDVDEVMKKLDEYEEFLKKEFKKHST